MTGDQPEPTAPDHGSAAADTSAPPQREVGAATAAESTMALPPVRHRWRRELREDIDPEVHAAFYYLRGLIAGDGRPHKAIAEAMAISPAEFTKRFSLARETFPPWAGIAPLFGVLDRDPAPFWARWGRLWATPWASHTLTYYGEPERFPTLAARPAAADSESGPTSTVSGPTDGQELTVDVGAAHGAVSAETTEATELDDSPENDTLCDLPTGFAGPAEELAAHGPGPSDDPEEAWLPAQSAPPEVEPEAGPAVVEMGLETSGTLRLADLHAHRATRLGEDRARDADTGADSGPPPPREPQTPARSELPHHRGAGPHPASESWVAQGGRDDARLSGRMAQTTAPGPQRPARDQGQESSKARRRPRRGSRRALVAAVTAAILAGGIGVAGTWAVTRTPAAEAGPVALLGAATAPADAPAGNASLRQAPDLAAPVVVPAGNVGTVSAACTVPAVKLAEDAVPGNTTTWLRTTDGAFLPSVYFRAANGANSLQSCERPDVQLPFGMFHTIIASSVAPTSAPALQAAATTTRPRRTTTARATQERVTTPPTTTTDQSPQPGDPNYHPCDDPKNYAECDYNMSKAAATPGWKPSNS